MCVCERPYQMVATKYFIAKFLYCIHRYFIIKNTNSCDLVRQRLCVKLTGGNSASKNLLSFPSRHTASGAFKSLDAQPRLRQVNLCVKLVSPSLSLAVSKAQHR